jgi:CheY-like chemotaxis protein
VMDYMLPGISGWDAIRLLKADALTAHIPILNVTAYSYGDVAEDAYRAGCDEFLEKPCDPFEIVHAVDRWVKRDRLPPAPPRATPPRLDTGERAISVR